MEGAIYVQNSANTVGGVNLVDATAVWQDITAQDAANNTITFQVTNAATGTSSGGGGDNCYMCIISDTHEETDGPTYGSVARTLNLTVKNLLIVVERSDKSLLTLV